MKVVQLVEGPGYQNTDSSGGRKAFGERQGGGVVDDLQPSRDIMVEDNTIRHPRYIGPEATSSCNCNNEGRNGSFFRALKFDDKCSHATL
jgi:hypothetical protein